MQLLIERFLLSDRSSIGDMIVNPQDNVKHFCYTLEDRDRLSEGQEKVYGETAIPCGTYLVTLTYSKHFNKVLPLLHDVPGFEGVRIHSGNKPEDTEGCILLGEHYAEDWISNSRSAFARLYNMLVECQNLEEEVWLTIRHKEV